MSEYFIPEKPGKPSVKLIPFSAEAESSVLGGLFHDPQAFEKIADKIKPDDFYLAKHKLVFEAIVTLVNQGDPIDQVLVLEQIEKIGQLHVIGDAEFLSDLIESTPSAANIVQYAAKVHERAMLRNLIGINNQISDLARLPGELTAYEVVDKAGQEIFALAQGRKTGGPISIKEVLVKTVAKLDKLYNADGDGITGLNTGFKDLNIKTGGLQNSDLIIIAGRPGMGKTTFAMNIVENVAMHDSKGANKPVLVFSLEMPAESLGVRLIASYAGIDQVSLLSGKIADEDWIKITSAVSMFERSKLFIDDSVKISPLEMRSRARRVAHEHGDLGLIMVDYLQLMKVPGFSHDNRVNEIAEISRSLKIMAREFNCPVIALSQLNRAVDNRKGDDKRPNMSDLRDSGAIEQDADVILFLYRPEYYDKEKTDPKDIGITEVIIGKQRNGPTGTVRLSFVGKYSKFADLVGAVYADEADSYAEKTNENWNKNPSSFDSFSAKSNTKIDTGYGVV